MIISPNVSTCVFFPPHYKHQIFFFSIVAGAAFIHRQQRSGEEDREKDREREKERESDRRDREKERDRDYERSTSIATVAAFADVNFIVVAVALNCA